MTSVALRTLTDFFIGSIAIVGIKMAFETGKDFMRTLHC